MSNAVTNRCKRTQLPPVQKAVLMALADRADDDGFTWLSIPGIMEWTCLSRTAVIDGFKGLERAGLLAVIRETGRNNRCTILLDKFPAALEDPSATRTRPPGAPVRHPAPTRPPAAPLPVREADPTRPPGAPDTPEHINQTPGGHLERAATAVATPPIVTRQKGTAADAVREIPGVPAEVLRDWLEVRKAKRAGKLTATAVAGLLREAEKAGISAAEAVRCCCEAGWQGFNAEWYGKRIGSAPNRQEALEVRGSRVAREWAKTAAARGVFGPSRGEVFDV